MRFHAVDGSITRITLSDGTSRYRDPGGRQHEKRFVRKVDSRRWLDEATSALVNLEAQDPASLATFWASVTGSTPAPGGDTLYLPPTGPGGFAMFFHPQEGPRPERQAVHLDLTVPWGSRQAEVQRLIGLGATHRWNVLDEFPHVQWTTLADPEGDLFCVAEHPPA
jgi:hypothetical protein